MADPWKRREVIGNATLYLGDCREILPDLEVFDVMISDPPYGVGIKYGPEYDDNPKTYWDWFVPAVEFLRTRAKTLIFTHRVSALHQLHGWDWVGVWNKPGAFGSRLGNSCVLPHWEPVFMYGIHDLGPKSRYSADVFTFNPEPAKAGTKGIGREKWDADEFTDHPCPKPRDLYDSLVAAFGQISDTICDPFMGSATTGVSALGQGKKFVGIEKCAKHFGACCEHIENAQRQKPMFDAHDKVERAEQQKLEI